MKLRLQCGRVSPEEFIVTVDSIKGSDWFEVTFICKEDDKIETILPEIEKAVNLVLKRLKCN